MPGIVPALQIPGYRAVANRAKSLLLEEKVPRRGGCGVAAKRRKGSTNSPKTNGKREYGAAGRAMHAPTVGAANSSLSGCYEPGEKSLPPRGRCPEGADEEWRHAAKRFAPKYRGRMV